MRWQCPGLGCSVRTLPTCNSRDKVLPHPDELTGRSSMLTGQRFAKHLGHKCGESPRCGSWRWQSIRMGIAMQWWNTYQVWNETKTVQKGLHNSDIGFVWRSSHSLHCEWLLPWYRVLVRKRYSGTTWTQKCHQRDGTHPCGVPVQIQQIYPNGLGWEKPLSFPDK